METNGNKNIEKNPTEFYCKICDYKCFTKTLWKQHVMTKKHNRKRLPKNIFTPEMVHDPKKKILQIDGLPREYILNNFECEICGKRYNDRSGLWKHKKKCNKIPDSSNKNINYIVNNLEEENNNLKDILKDIMKDYSKNSEITQQMMNQLQKQNLIIQEMIPKLGNNNNNKFNINLFLNEQCKDALNLSDFINSLKVQKEDIIFTRENGLIEGISTVVLNGLKQLNIFQRPIHCIDIKREILYIKENDTWEKNLDKEKIQEAISEVAFKQRDAIKQWESTNPLWSQSEKGKEDYINLVKTLMEDIHKNSHSENKIIKSIIKETLLDK